MDIQMPLMDGLQAAREIRTLGKSVWITALTHDVTPGAISLCTDSGMDDYLVGLPLRLDDLMEAIKNFRAARAKHDGINSGASLHDVVYKPIQ